MKGISASEWLNSSWSLVHLKGCHHRWLWVSKERIRRDLFLYELSRTWLERKEIKWLEFVTNFIYLYKILPNWILLLSLKNSMFVIQMYKRCLMHIFISCKCTDISLFLNICCTLVKMLIICKYFNF